MKLYKFNTQGISAWYISQASAEFKKKFPNKMIVVSASKNKIENVNDFSDLTIQPEDVTYLFVQNDKVKHTCSKTSSLDDMMELWNWNYRLSRLTHELTTAMPDDNSKYFVGCDKDVDVVFCLIPKNPSEFPLIYKPLIIRQNHEFIKSTELRKSLDKIVHEIYSSKSLKSINTTEKWLNCILNEIPVGLYGESYKFGKVITDETFNNVKTPTIDDFIITYSLRIGNIQEEFDFIQTIEQELCHFDADITIYQDYNDIVSKLEESCKKHKFKYTKNDDISITIDANDFYKIDDVEYQITDFIS